MQDQYIKSLFLLLLKYFDTGLLHCCTCCTLLRSVSSGCIAATGPGGAARSQRHHNKHMECTSISTSRAIFSAARLSPDRAARRPGSGTRATVDQTAARLVDNNKQQGF
jgi:hypothetical protein